MAWLAMSAVDRVARFAPWRAQALSQAAKDKHFRNVMDLQAESVLLGRSAIIAGWVIGGVGAAAFIASIAGWLMILPLKTTEMKFYEVDRSTGIIGVPVSLEDAPKLFSEATDHEYLKRYIMACEQWVPDVDRQNDRLCKLMSTPEQQASYMARRAKPTSTPKTIGKAGHVELDNFRFHPQATDKTTGTHRYWVQFDRSVWKGSNLEETKTWSASVDFKYQPEREMVPQDRDDNRSGLQVSSFTVTSDTPNRSEAPK